MDPRAAMAFLSTAKIPGHLLEESVTVVMGGLLPSDGIVAVVFGAATASPPIQIHNRHAPIPCGRVHLLLGGEVGDEPEGVKVQRRVRYLAGAEIDLTEGQSNA
jgi:hypothetical protein